MILFFWVFFFIFSRKQALTFQANCLHWRQFAWNVKTCFLGENKYIWIFRLLKSLPRVQSVNLNALHVNNSSLPYANAQPVAVVQSDQVFVSRLHTKWILRNTPSIRKGTKQTNAYVNVDFCSSHICISFWRIYPRYSAIPTQPFSPKILNNSILLCTVYMYLLWAKPAGWVTNSVDPDQTPRSAASDLGLHFLS